MAGLGIPKILHADNGPDFQSEDVKRSCSNIGIENQFRPVKRPRYGAHIERLMGTFAQTLKDMPGRTYSNQADRAGYDSEKHSALTFDEFETWLIREILIYNEEYHSKIYMSPSRKWHIGIFGNSDQDPLVGIPPRPTDPFTLQRDFLPSFDRTVQHYGVQIDLMYYSKLCGHGSMLRIRTQEKRGHLSSVAILETSVTSGFRPATQTIL